MCRINTLGKIPPWVRVSKSKGKNVESIAPMECSESLETTKWSQN
jgi:hypothetical protein